MIEFDPHKLMVCGYNAITIIDTTKWQIDVKIELFQKSNIFSLMKLRNGNLLCGCFDGMYI